MIKYSIPTIKITHFLSENIVTGSKSYINEVEQFSQSRENSQVMVESVNDLLRYN